MEKELINDERLTPDMEVIRCGSTMLFRKDYGDREFTRKGNADVVIKAPRNELFAKLINGKWYWINDCPECKGQEPQWAYVKCEEHDRCVDCRKKRSEIEGTIWGHRQGFQCQSCKELEDKITRRKALEKVAEKEYDPWDYQNEDKILCPHCGSEIYHDDGDGDPSGEMDCDVCNGKFKIETEYTVTYSTSIIGERITLNKENEEWEKKYVNRLIERGIEPEFAKKTMEAGKSDFDYLADPVDLADEELSKQKGGE